LCVLTNASNERCVVRDDPAIAAMRAAGPGDRLKTCAVVGMPHQHLPKCRKIRCAAERVQLEHFCLNLYVGVNLENCRMTADGNWNLVVATPMGERHGTL
jgi:hypothetical protein